MSKKFVYFFSALTMLALAIAIAFIFSKPIPDTLAIEDLGQVNNIKSQPLEKVENIMGGVNYEPEKKSQQEITEVSTPKTEPKKAESIATKNPEPQNIPAPSPEQPNIPEAHITENVQETQGNVVQNEAEKLYAELLGDVENKKIEQTNPSPTPNITEENISSSSSDVEKTENVDIEQKDKPLPSMFEQASEVADSNIKNNQKSEPIQENTQEEKKEIDSSPSKDKPSNAKIIAKTNLDPKNNAPTVIFSQLSEENGIYSLTLEGNQALDGKTFRLENPDRIVLDIRGMWAITAPKVSNDNTIKGIRSGKTKTHTRLVFDLTRKPQNPTLTQVNDKTLKLNFN